MEKDLLLISNEFAILNQSIEDIQFNDFKNLNPEKYDDKTAAISTAYIDEMKLYYKHRLYKANQIKDKIYIGLAKELGSDEAVARLKEDYYNKQLAVFVLNKNDIKKIVETEEHRLIQMKDPIFKKPETEYGRAHFYASQKYLFGLKIKTLWFNLSIIWLSILFMYIMLLFNGSKKLMDYFSNINIFNSSNR